MKPHGKVILKTKSYTDDDGLKFVIKDDGDLGLCLTMALGYVADLIVDNEASIKEVTQLLKDMVKEEKERRGEGTWL